jgi:hypothetical protein
MTHRRRPLYVRAGDVLSDRALAASGPNRYQLVLANIVADVSTPSPKSRACWIPRDDPVSASSPPGRRGPRAL